MTALQPHEIEQLTPMLKQFYELKARAEDAILFFRMGDFYEIFGTDAEEVAPILDLVLTSRERGDKNRIPFCGVPHHSSRSYWLKLLKLGYRVAIADQIEDPATAKGLVKRDIVQILTPGCIDEPEGLDADRPNYLVAVYEEPQKKVWALLAMDLSTGEIRLGNIPRDSLAAWTTVFQAREILLRRFMVDEVRAELKSGEAKVSFSALPEAPLRDKEEQLRFLKAQFAVSSLGELPCGNVVGGLELLTASFHYLQSLKASIGQFLSVKTLKEDDRVVLDETVRRDLELFETVRRRDTEGSLLRELNLTKTSMGARLLRHDLARPFLRPEPIVRRQDAVHEILVKPQDWMQDLQKSLKGCADLDRLTTRILSRKASPPDLNNIRQSLEACRFLQGFLRDAAPKSSLLQEIAAELGRGKEAGDRLQQSLSDNPCALGSLDVFRKGFDAELDQLSELSRHGAAEIDVYEQKLKEQTGIASLKIKEHKTYGLLIEITKANLAKVPSTFIRRQTMVNNERFVTMELEDLAQKLLTASEQAELREAFLFEKLLDGLSPYQEDLRRVSEAIALLDLLQAFAQKAYQDRYTRPRLAKDGQIQLKGCRHPVVERWVGSHAFMPNDIELSPSQKQMLITGPNMGGKSTVMRQTALAAILHQIGSYVPAMEAKLPLFDKIFTRVGAADDLSRGQSTFMVEMSEAATILRQATKQSLVILDEVGRGTSTQDGLAIASAILRYIARDIGCYTLFATHYHELVEISESLPSVRLAQVEVIEEKQGIRFTHRLMEGACDSSFGVEVAKLAGIPDTVIQAAKQFLETAPDLSVRAPARASAAPEIRKVTPPLEAGFGSGGFPFERTEQLAVQTILERLDRVNVLKTTPLQALAILDELKATLEKKGQASLFPESPQLC